MSTPILDTKLNIPALRQNVLNRDHLQVQLDTLLEPGRKLALLAAPAGFGKTTLAANWISRLSGWRTGWLSLGSEHDDPVVFLTYLVRIFERLYPGSVADIEAVLNSGAAGSGYVLSLLINALAGIDDRTVLVLDDYHELIDQRIHDAISYFVEHLPESVRLILTSRVDPPLPLGRMRARGQLVEIRADDLRFSSAETDVFLDQVMNLQISTTLKTMLEARTEGWVTGLQLAALSLRKVQDAQAQEQFVQDFAGSHRYVVDYLAGEVLQRESAGVLDFLMQTAIFDRFCPALCDYVTQTDTSRAMLNYLDRSNLFLIALDNEQQWYRYHPLFVDLLRLRLRHDRPDSIKELHNRAASWFESEGLTREAIHHALAGEDYKRAEILILNAITELMFRGEVQTIHQWLKALPRTTILARPRLCLEYARMQLLQHKLSDVDELLDAAERQLQRVSDQDDSHKLLLGTVVALRAYPAHEHQEFEASVAYSQQALTYFPPEKIAERGASLLYMAHSLHFGGWTRESVPHFLDAMTLLQKARNIFSTMMCMGQLATVYELLGNLHQARAILDDAFEWARTYGVEQLTPSAVPHVRMADILREWNQLAEAEEHLQAALRLAQGGRPLVEMRALVFQARLLMSRGDFVGAENALTAAHYIIRDWETDIERSFVEYHTMLLSLRQGNLTRVERWLQQEKLSWPDSSRPLPNYAEQKLLIRARFLMACGGESLSEALELLDILHEIAIKAGRMGIVIEVSILLALAYAALNRHAPAQRALSEALRYAMPQGYVHVFIDEGPPLLDLLAQIPHDHPQADYARQLLDEAHFHASNAALPKGLYETAEGLLLETLSERELQVLHLLAQGMSSNQVADHLIIAVETARKHIKNIYGKLDVHNKVEAVRRAQELHLI